MNTSQKKQAFNPYLPLDTYVPDGEPHVFGDRLYVFGSHDKEGPFRAMGALFALFSPYLHDSIILAYR